MKLFYWEDPASLGYDCVAQAGSLEEARSLAKEKLRFERKESECVDISLALDDPPTGIFHYPAALWIYTEIDTKHARLCREEWAELSRQMRERASFADTSASLTRLLLTWADVIDGKPDVGWGPRNREDLQNENGRKG